MIIKISIKMKTLSELTWSEIKDDIIEALSVGISMIEMDGKTE